jgi:hypothetical protein
MGRDQNKIKEVFGILSVFLGKVSPPELSFVRTISFGEVLALAVKCPHKGNCLAGIVDICKRHEHRSFDAVRLRFPTK